MTTGRYRRLGAEMEAIIETILPYYVSITLILLGYEWVKSRRK